MAPSAWAGGGVTLGDAMLAGEARAFGQFSDVVRSRGGTYRDACRRIKEIFEKAGRSITDAEIDAKFGEADDLERGS